MAFGLLMLTYFVAEGVYPNKCVRIVLPAPAMKEFALPPMDTGFVSLSSLIPLVRQRVNDPITDFAIDTLRKRLIPHDGDVTWFDTEDANDVFTVPKNMRRFFEVVRILYPEFDSDLAIMRATNSLSTNNGLNTHLRVQNFIRKLYFRALTSLTYFRDDRNPHGMQTADPIFTLEDMLSRTVWRELDAPNTYPMLTYDTSPMENEIYVVFKHPIRSMYRLKVHSAINWEVVEKRMKKRTAHSSDMSRAHFELFSDCGSSF